MYRSKSRMSRGDVCLTESRDVEGKVEYNIQSTVTEVTGREGLDRE